MNHISFKILILSVILLSSCTSRTSWTKEGFNSEQWNVDKTRCEEKSLSIFPPLFPTDHLEPPLETDGHSVNCTTPNEASNSIPVTEDLNKDNRKMAWETCICGLGYYTVDEHQQKNNCIESATLKIQIDEQEICQRAEFADFYKKAACNEDDITLEQLSDKSKATAKEKAIISQIRTEQRTKELEIAKSYLKYGGKKGAKASLLIKKYIKLFDQNNLKLYKGKISFGEFNKKRQELKSKFEADIQKIYFTQ